jgi:Centromere/kinetochore Zw10
MVEDESLSIEDRIHAIKLAIRKSTEEALNSASCHDTLEMKLQVPDMAPSVVSTQKENNNPNCISSESFTLGMTLFGQDTFVIERSIQDKLSSIENELQDVMCSLRDGGEHLSQEKLEIDASNLRKRIEFLQICSKVRAKLDQASSMTAASANSEPDYLAAADFLVSAKSGISDAEIMVKNEESQLSSPNNAILGAHRILDSIRTSFRRKSLDLTSKATTLLESSVKVTRNSITVKSFRTTNNGSNIPNLQVAFDVIQKLSPSNSHGLDRSMRTLTNSLVKTVLSQIFDELKQGVSAPWIFTESSDRLATVLEWTREKKAEPTNILDAWKEAFSYWERILAFFQEKVLIHRDSLCALVGDYLFSMPNDSTSEILHSMKVESKLLRSHTSSILKTILDLMWETCIPEKLSSKDLSKLKLTSDKIKTFTESFNAKMLSIKFYSDTSKSSPIADFVSNFSQQFVEKRRIQLLNEARNILLNNDYHNTMEVGEEIKKQPSIIGDGSVEVDGFAVFRLHKCSVSQTSTLILNLTRQTMEEATYPIPSDDETLSLLPSLLYRTSREILDLFRAIIPVSFLHEISNVPRTAAILHNDCVFLAHNCLTLGLEYKEKFPTISSPDDIRGFALRQACMFVDMVPIFRELADKAMGDMLEKQHGQIHDIVGSRVVMFGASLKSNECLSEWVDAETAMKAGIFHAQHLARAWRPVLSADVYRRSIGFIVDTIFNIFLEQMFQASDISEPASHLVGSVFRLGMQGALDVTGNDVSGCLTWERFSAVGRFMEMSLADINVALSDGVFRSITGHELTRLITATFDDGDKRRRLLQALASES